MRLQFTSAVTIIACCLGLCPYADAQETGEIALAFHVVSDESVQKSGAQQTEINDDPVTARASCASSTCSGRHCGRGKRVGSRLGLQNVRSRFFPKVEYNGRQYGTPDLFYNYYSQGTGNGVNAQMYLAPHPVPPHVGHTFITYQPLMPHEMLYSHKDRYHNYYDNGRGTNRTKVSYYSPPIRQAFSNLYWNVLRIPR